MAKRSITIPQTRLDFARILKENDNNISQTIVKLEEYFELDLAKRDSLHGILSRIRDTVRKSKKSLDSMGGEWWNSAVFLESDFKIQKILQCIIGRVLTTFHRSNRIHVYQLYWTLSDYLLKLKTFQKSRLMPDSS